ncbi:hypothetical protein BDN72DRAFT_795291 [Pluteus cervinus]|uniref:Uncharacterized protein n=1 Tax=Pluteus cervinus TaxID=181527 RepID=A0ACD3AXD8_9AGAR|nr:hypothetical protein BDN72DRAFT_795291 [Pluteus cervinus]
MAPITSNRKYSEEEKRQLLANLEIEVAHRTRQFEAWLADHLENFSVHQQGQVSRIPKQVRNMTMREFGDKYGGNVQAALRGYQRERLVAAGADATLGEIDKSMRKRKWVASQEAIDGDTSTSQQSKELEPRASKNARTIAAVPQHKPRPGSSTGPGTAQRSRLLNGGVNRTPSASRTLSRIPASPSPQKPRPPFSTSTNPSSSNRPPSRPTSPVKHPSSKPGLNRVPSSSTFNPTLPPKTPAYPGGSQGRLPQKGESMLSVNGSPIANPFDLGMKWFKTVALGESDQEEETQPVDQPVAPKRTGSDIIVRRDPSVAFGGLHSRTNSQGSLFSSSSQPATQSSQSSAFSHLQPRYPSTAQPQPTNGKPLDPQTPKPKLTRSFSALVAIPTKDGHLLEFDPLQTSPSALDALEGITNSAKKQARVEMGRLIQAAVDKWKIG